MTRILILFFALLMLGGLEAAEAARPTAYARAKMKGRTFTHRPFYRKYKGSKKHRSLFGRKASSSKSTYRVGHSTR
jgi:hypothetical protein